MAIERKGNPISRTSPGEILLHEFLKPIGMTKAELAERTGLPESKINGIAEAKQPVTYDVAKSFGRIFKTSAEFWMNLQNAYDKK